MGLVRCTHCSKKADRVASTPHGCRLYEDHEEPAAKRAVSFELNGRTRRCIFNVRVLLIVPPTSVFIRHVAKTPPQR